MTTFDDLIASLSELFQTDITAEPIGLHRIVQVKQQLIDKWLADRLSRCLNETWETLDLLASDERRQLTAEISRQLLEFFRRYYQSGEFTAPSLTPTASRSGATQRNGQEVVLHWTNKEQHFIQSTHDQKRNPTQPTPDYFIHRRLGEYFQNELDAFIKDQWLQFVDNDDRPGNAFENEVRTIRAFRVIAQQLIECLSQIEEFQKRLWLKKPFVTETHWLISLDHIPDALYPEIAANDPQRRAWVKWFGIDEIQGDLLTPGYSEPLTIEFLNANSSLILDTAFFSAEFKHQLLAAIHDIDANTDGLLIHGDNFAALRLINNVFRRRVQCIHIDPPYNAASTAFLYKNRFQHSSWLTMMADRIHPAAQLLGEDGSFLCHIDENEYESLHKLFEETGIPDAGTIVWDKRNPMTAGGGVAIQHEYVICRSHRTGALYLNRSATENILAKAKQLCDAAGGVTQSVRKRFSAWISRHGELSGGEKAYRHIDDEGRVFQSVSLRAPEPRTDPKFHQPLIHPRTGKPCPVPPNGFSRTPQTLADMIERGEILFGDDESTQPRQKMILKAATQRQITSVIRDAKKGKPYTDALGIEFPYCHPVSLYQTLLGATVDPHGICLDFFAGSGTTAQALLELNRDDGGHRKYVLVEMGEHFDSVLKPRVCKIAYSPDWRKGHPRTRDQGLSSIIKYIRLESFEDTLNNLMMEDGLPDAPATTGPPPDRISLRYRVDLNTDRSLLDGERFIHPFDCCLSIFDTAVGKPRPAPVDLPETFNYLLGLRVRTMQLLEGVLVIEADNPANEPALVIWRNVNQMDNKKLETFFSQKLRIDTSNCHYAAIYINGANTLDDPRKRIHLSDRVFHELMFDRTGI